MTAKLTSILCIDDEPDVLLVAKMCLEKVYGYTVTAASSGKEGVNAAMAATPDAILLDVMMPEMDGPATLKALRDIPSLSSVPIIFMTARVRPAEIDEYLAMGANGVIPKPFDLTKLGTQITEACETFHANE
jgi:two-component system OmpR family response regulator